MREEGLPLRGATVRSLPRANRVWGAGRTCAEDGCITSISIYNRSTYCWAHAPLHYYVARGRKKAAQAA
ncbi:MAG TPA: hypothetical protein VGP44_02185 [Gemmatimonadales bacterium]|nr:hypothetical protein [Gemmatimonadales bacterium]